MSDVNKVRSNAGVQYGFEDVVARLNIEDLKSVTGNLNALQTESKSDLVSAINEAAQSGSDAGGQPTPITLASQMTDTSVIYLYLGSENGYDYGYIYAYVNDEWAKTSLYGKGQNGADGYSPTATVTSTPTGAVISVTDKSGTTTAAISNGTATQEQVDAWLDDHPEATTTVADGSITVEKLASDVVDKIESASGTEEVETPFYEVDVLYDLTPTGKDGLIKGTMTNNVPIPSESGTQYFTPYISKQEWVDGGYSTVRGNTFTPGIWFYDSEKNFIEKKTVLLSPTNWPTGDQYAYVVMTGNTTYFSTPYEIRYNKQKTEKIGTQPPKGTSTYKIVEETRYFEMGASTSEMISPWGWGFPIIPGETYVITTQGYHNALIRNANNDNLTGNITGNTTIVAPAAGVKLVSRGGNARTKMTVTGKFPVEDNSMPDLSLVPSNFTEEIYNVIAENLGISTDRDPTQAFYIATQYGVLPANTDNTSAMNTLITTVSNNGGGIIFIPVGTYNFTKDGSTSAMGGNAQNCVYLKNNVSIIGESLCGTILKLSGSTQTGCSLFGYFKQDNNNAPVVGCTFSNFTVDMSELTMSTYSHKGKAFYTSGMKDCVFRDLRLLSTPSTALGIDMLDNVVMDSIYVYQGGRQWSAGGNGGAGIGIGTGNYANENFVIRNCVCDSCGHFGIFLESQGLFAATPTVRYSKGQIITNNVVRNGRNYGIGLRGNQYAMIQGNNVYSNTNGGIYLDFGTDRCVIKDNLISDESKAVCFGNETSAAVCTRIVVANNTFAGCTDGVVQTLTPTDCVIQDNITVA